MSRFDEGFYINGDDGYHWLTHEVCEEPILNVEAGTPLTQVNDLAGAHVCPKGNLN